MPSVDVILLQVYPSQSERAQEFKQKFVKYLESLMKLQQEVLQSCPRILIVDASGFLCS